MTDENRTMSRRPFLKALAASALLAPAAARAQQRRDLRESERVARNANFELTTPELWIPHLDEAHDGLVVGHLTDIHIGPRTPDERILSAVDALNEARPDIVILTGDYVTRKGDPLERVPELLGRLKIPAVAVLGNHDHWTDAATITRDLERVGIPVLRNRNTVMQVHGAPLTLVGIDDAVSGHDDVERSLKGVKDDVARIVLAHSPPTLDTLPHGKGLACFSGHTHGGQIFISGVTDAFFSRAGQPYLRGHFEKNGNQLYVSRGLGFGKGSNLPRMNADPEVALVTLKRLPPATARAA